LVATLSEDAEILEILEGLTLVKLDSETEVAVLDQLDIELFCGTDMPSIERGDVCVDGRGVSRVGLAALPVEAVASSCHDEIAHRVNVDT